MTTAGEERATSPDIYYALTAHTRDLVALLEADGMIRYASPSFQRILGYAPTALQGTSAHVHVHPEDVERVQAAFAAAMQADDGTLVSLHCRYRHADGSWRVLQMTGSSHLANPDIHGFTITGHDITERLLA